MLAVGRIVGVTASEGCYAQGYAMWRHDDAVLRGAVGAEDDGTRVVIHIQSVPPVCVDKVRVGYIPLVPQMLPSKPDFHLS